MKKLIINHCSHNKGDNSVLCYLVNMLGLKKEPFTISTSSGELPEWADSSLCNSVIWGPGRWFNYKDITGVKYKLFRIKQEIYIRIFSVIIFLYSNNYDKLVRAIFNVIYNKKFLKEIRESELIISTGGHHISSVLDKDGINPQLVDMICADVNNKKLLLWAQSIGPVVTNKSYIHKAISKLINNTEKTYYRCDNSFKYLDDINALSKTEELDDSVFGLCELLNLKKNPYLNNKKVVISIYNSSSREKTSEDEYIYKIKEITKYFIRKDFKVDFLPMQYKGKPGDERPLINEIIKDLPLDKVSVIDFDLTPIETINLVSEYDFVIGHKTHSVVYGLALGIPTYAIAYHPKTRYFMRRFELEKYCIDEIDFLDRKLSFDVFDEMINNSQELKETIANKSHELGLHINTCFNENIK